VSFSDPKEESSTPGVVGVDSRVTEEVELLLVVVVGVGPGVEGGATIWGSFSSETTVDPLVK